MVTFGALASVFETAGREIKSNLTPFSVSCSVTLDTPLYFFEYGPHLGITSNILLITLT